jgi:hypothetical protein
MSLVGIEDLSEQTGVRVSELRKLVLEGDLEVAGQRASGELLFDEDESLEVIDDTFEDAEDEAEEDDSESEPEDEDDEEDDD